MKEICNGDSSKIGWWQGGIDMIKILLMHVQNSLKLNIILK